MSLSANVNEKAALIWAIADKLTGVYKPHEYGEVILPLTVIRRFDCILVDTKDAVLEKYESVKNLPMRDVLLRRAAGVLGGTLWEAATARCFYRNCLPDRAVWRGTADCQQSHRTLS
jgi:type I restriction-modification system DNA methylase subunit